MTKLYARAPKEVDPPYIEGGKAYPVLEEKHGGFYLQFPGIDNKSFCLWNGCAYIDGQSWTREEVEDEDDTRSNAGS